MWLEVFVKQGERAFRSRIYGFYVIARVRDRGRKKEMSRMYDDERFAELTTRGFARAPDCKSLKKQRWTHAQNCQAEIGVSSSRNWIQRYTGIELKKRGAPFWRVLAFPLRSTFFFSLTTPGVDAPGGGWIRHSEYEPRTTVRVKKKWRCAFYSGIEVTVVAMWNDLPRALFSPFSLFFNRLFPPFSGRVSLAELGELWRALCPACHTDAIIDAHTLPFPILVPPSRARARICAKGPLHLAYTTIFFDQGFYYVRAFFFESRAEALTRLRNVLIVLPCRF